MSYPTHNDDGTPTAYGFACGYIELHGPMSISKETNDWIVRGFIDSKHVWESFETLAKARRFAKYPDRPPLKGRKPGKPKVWDVMQAFTEAGFRFHTDGTTKDGRKKIADVYLGDVLTEDMRASITESLHGWVTFGHSRKEYAPELRSCAVIIPTKDPRKPCPKPDTAP